MRNRIADAQFSDEAIARRSADRRNRMVSHKAADFKEAEQWDLIYWQEQGPEARLSALMAIREDVEKAQAARKAP